MIRIRLDEQEFRDLVRGAVAKVRTSSGEEAELILADIGLSRLYAIVNEALVESVRDRDP